MLNLPHWSILHTEETDHNYQLTATYAKEPSACLSCGSVTPLYRFGKKSQLFLDLPIHAKRVGILVQRQRYRCRDCGVTFLQPLPDMEEQRLMTRRLLFYIQRESLHRTFVTIAAEVGVDEKTIRNIFRAYAEHLKATTKLIAPAWLGIDEVFLVRKPRCILTNVQERTILDLLPNRQTLAQYLMHLGGAGQIEIVCMDMWAPYREAAQTLLPQARIVIDKFHVVRVANQVLDGVRKTLRAELEPPQRRQLLHDRFVLLKRRHDLDEQDWLKLEAWKGAYPLLSHAYDLKEGFYDVWEATSQVEAFERYEAWHAQIPADLLLAFQPLLTALTNWRQEIFAYFALAEPAATNACTEAINGLIKLANRNGRGYSFEAIRAKMLYGSGPPKLT
jgi:transposase